MSWCFVLIVFLGLCFFVGIVAVRQTPRSALWCGGLLAAFALAASLFAPMFLHDAAPAQVQYVVNSLLVVASVGANLLAGGLCFHLKAKPKGHAPVPPKPSPATVPSAPVMPAAIIGIGIGVVIGRWFGPRDV